MILFEQTVDELKKTAIGANSSTLAKINQIKKAIESKTPDDILLTLQKSEDLSQYFQYWQSRSCQDPSEIKATIQGHDRQIIHVLIDLHILKLISGEPSKIIWKDPNIVNPQGKLSVSTKKPDYNSQTKIALILGVSRQAVQKLCKGKFKPALNDKGKVNLWHPIVQQHKADLEAKKAAVSGPVPKPITKNESGNGYPSPLPQTNNGYSDFKTEISFSDIENLTVKQVVERYGGIQGFKNYVDSLKAISDWKNKEQKYRKDRKKLIEKNPVAMSIYSIINIGFKRILEYPETVTDQLTAIAKGKKKTARIDMVALQEQTLSKILKNVKAEALKSLNDAGKD